MMPISSAPISSSSQTLSDGVLEILELSSKVSFVLLITSSILME